MVHANIQRLKESWVVSSLENMKNMKDMGVWSSPWGFWDVDEEEDETLNLACALKRSWTYVCYKEFNTQQSV